MVSTVAALAGEGNIARDRFFKYETVFGFNLKLSIMNSSAMGKVKLFLKSPCYIKPEDYMKSIKKYFVSGGK